MVSRAAFSNVDRADCLTDRCSDANPISFIEPRLVIRMISDDCTIMTVFAYSDLFEVRRFLAIQLLGVDIVMPQPMLRAPEVP